MAIEGAIIEVGVPRLRCACGGTVDLSFAVFAPYERVSGELAERLRETVALGLTLRQVGEVTAPANGGPLGKSTIKTRVLEASGLASAFHRAALGQIPPVVLVDGLWIKVLELTMIVYLEVRVEAASRGEAWDVRYLRATRPMPR